MSCGEDCLDGLKRFTHGAVARSKSMVGIGIAPPEVVAARRDICRECEHCTRNPAPEYAAAKGMTTKSRCGVCRCPLKHKTRLASESCPKSYWTKFVPLD